MLWRRWCAVVGCVATLASCGDGSYGGQGAINGVNNGVNNGANNGANNGTVDADPGRVTLHRLNRAEYNNTVRDLLGTRLRPADDFPADDFGYGFDNNADVLTMSPLLLELYEQSATTLIDEALDEGIPEATDAIYEAEEVGAQVGGVYRNAWNLWSNGELAVVHDFPAAGTYRLRARVSGTQAGPDPVMMSINLDGVEAEIFVVNEQLPEFAEFEVDVDVAVGLHQVGVSFLNDFYEPDEELDRNLIIDWVGVSGPYGVEAGPNPERARILFCDLAQDGCPAQVIEAFAKRAWRRPVTPQEVSDLMALLEVARSEGDDVEAGVRLALISILLAPDFSYRVELDPDPDDDTPHALNPFELANRLSYFLWSSMPDDTLLAAAENGALSTDSQIRGQVERMLEDPRARALVENFTGQWLEIRALDDVVPDYQAYPEYDDELRDLFRAETESFFDELLHSDTPVTGLLEADHTYANDRLAAFYGLPQPGTDDLMRVAAGEQRGGILTHGSVLTVTSYPTRTSPVKRGKWVLTQLLCSGPPPPPPGVEGLIEENDSPGTLREKLEQHRADPACAGCHALMDPLGFGMEGFDGIGAHRTEDNGDPIDNTGELTDGTTFRGAREMSAVLVQDDRFVECVAKQLFTYALGRGPEFHDSRTLRALYADWRAAGLSLRELIVLIATSRPFTMRRGE